MSKEKPVYLGFNTYKRIDDKTIEKNQITDEHIKNLSNATNSLAQIYTATGIFNGIEQIKNAAEVVNIMGLDSDTLKHWIDVHIKNSYEIDTSDCFYIDFFLKNANNMFPRINGNMKHVVYSDEPSTEKIRTRGMRTAKKIYKSFTKDAMDKTQELWNSEKAGVLLEYIQNPLNKTAKTNAENMLAELGYKKEHMNVVNLSVKKMAESL